MGKLLDVLKLPDPRQKKAAPASTASMPATPVAGNSAPTVALADAGGQMPSMPAMANFQDNIDEMFPVTLNGKTKEMIAKELSDAKIDFQISAAQEKARRDQAAAAEAALAPLAKKVAEMMKTPIAALSAEIQQNTTAAMVNVGRRAQLALNQRNTAATLLRTVKDLADGSRSEVEETAKRIEAAAQSETAAGLREQAAKITEVFEALEKILDVGVDLASGDEIAMAKSIGKIALWAEKAAAGADELIAQASALEKKAKELQNEALRQQAESVGKLFRRLGTDAKQAQADLAASDRALAQNAGDAQHSYDGNSKRKNKSTFKFSDFQEATKQGAASLDILEQGMKELQSDMLQLNSEGKDLADLLRIEGKCLSHHGQSERSAFAPDPRVVLQKTDEMKAQVKAGLVEIVGFKKQLVDEKQERSAVLDALRRRQEQWVTYYAAAQGALYSAPDPG